MLKGHDLLRFGHDLQVIPHPLHEQDIVKKDLLKPVFCFHKEEIPLFPGTIRLLKVLHDPIHGLNKSVERIRLEKVIGYMKVKSFQCILFKSSGDDNLRT